MRFAINREGIAATECLIRSHIRRTPVVEMRAKDFGLDDRDLILKLESLQHAGSFKTRGAFANLLIRDVPSVGVAAASGGNHGAAVAYAAMMLGIPAKIFVPSISSPAKIARIRACDADLVVGGDAYADALAACDQWVASSGAMPVHAFDQAETILGQGTIGLELDSQGATPDTLLVSIGGGGLIAGIASWYERQVKIVGVEPEASPTMTRALAAGRPVDTEAGGIAADSLAPRRVGVQVFPIVVRHVSQTVLVTDDAIRLAQKTLWNTLRVVAEPGGAACFGALQSRRYQPAAGERVGVIVSGGNTVAVNFDQ